MMANPNKGEVDLTLFENDDDLRRTYKLKFTNSGHREMEDLLGMEQSEIEARINTGRVGARITTALFFGATRKFHRRDFPSVFEIDELMDEIDDEMDREEALEAAQKISTHLLAAYNRSQVSDFEARVMGEEPAKNAEAGEAPARDQDKPARGRKPKPKAETKGSGDGS